MKISNSKGQKDLEGESQEREKGRKSGSFHQKARARRKKRGRMGKFE